ncbi:hypothetical protein ACFPES_26810 [Paenibacillus sp. GCM10023248]|uniref:hypothetical protein n=1 Tax=unclassified Paenibacillus TaxID=185978 RepID=UPI002379DDD4|nr:hypothetical protein [Paenibacillus sp. MAHUQ-63]MDD9270673.1 hypothetical protein [Paenibacillus sp. MAHUQ-63]
MEANFWGCAKADYDRMDGHGSAAAVWRLTSGLRESRLWQDGWSRLSGGSMEANFWGCAKAGYDRMDGHGSAAAVWRLTSGAARKQTTTGWLVTAQRRQYGG